MRAGGTHTPSAGSLQPQSPAAPPKPRNKAKPQTEVREAANTLLTETLASELGSGTTLNALPSMQSGASNWAL